MLPLCVLGSSAALPRSAHLGKVIVHTPPRSRVASITTNGSSIPAGGAVWPTAIYWSLVQIGTPPVDFPVAIDSGSGDLDVSGKGCVGCVTAPPNRGYDEDASSTSTRVFPYTFSNTYQTCDLKNPTAPCSISGKLYSDKVSLAGFGPVDVTFGSILKQDSNFDQFKEIDGVMGFTMGGKQDVFARLVAAGECDDVWAMCMHEGSQSNGTLTIGGVDERLSDGEIAYVPDAGHGFHSVQVSSIGVGTSATSAGTSISLLSSDSIPVNEAAILDTGTNVLLLPSKILKALGATVCANASLPSCADLWAEKCVSLTEAQVAAYPSLTMKLQGTTLLMTGRDYLLQGSPLAPSAGMYCLGIRDGGRAGGTGFIIGDTTMRNYYLVFDLARKQIGWGAVNKKTCGSLLAGEVAPSVGVVAA